MAVELLRTPAARLRGGVAGLAALPLHAALKHACRNAALALRGRLPPPTQGSRCDCLAYFRVVRQGMSASLGFQQPPYGVLGSTRSLSHGQSRLWGYVLQELPAVLWAWHV